MAAVPLDAETVRVRWLAVPEDASHQSRWRAMLDDEELARADRFLFAEDRNTFTAAHALARAVLSEATGHPTGFWRYAKAPFGKPALHPSCAVDGLRFNISHTRGMVVCALARNDELGVDVEAADRRTNFRIADRFFAPEEARLVLAAAPEERARLFFRLWTLKEAFIKATGEGLRRPLDSFSFRLDPVRIAFHPEREDRPRHDDPAAWHFAEMLSAPERPVSLAVHRPIHRAVRLDVGGMAAEQVMAA
jgi:4'-phosphopantetheinyl transferase